MCSMILTPPVFHGVGEQLRGGINHIADTFGDRITNKNPDKNKARNEVTMERAVTRSTRDTLWLMVPSSPSSISSP